MKQASLIKIKTLIYSFIITGIVFFFNSGYIKGNSGSFSNTTTVKDTDGNVYNTVTIGNQTWMVENLRTTHYNDGQPISLLRDSATWANYTSEAYCWYNNDSTGKGVVYGALYNSYAVNNTAHPLAPKGWHIPSYAEWDTLINYLGGSEVAATALKESNNTHWESPNTGTNSSGFTALPGGVRHGIKSTEIGSSPGQFQFINQYGGWWTSTSTSADLQYSFWMFYDYAVVDTISESLNCGSSVRCIKNTGSSTGILNISLGRVNIYPNPVRENLVISIPNLKNQTTVEIFNLNGIKLYSVMADDVITNVNMTEYVAGIYFVKIISSDLGVITKTIVVNK